MGRAQYCCWQSSVQWQKKKKAIVSCAASTLSRTQVLVINSNFSHPHSWSKFTQVSFMKEKATPLPTSRRLRWATYILFLGNNYAYKWGLIISLNWNSSNSELHSDLVHCHTLICCETLWTLTTRLQLHADILPHLCVCHFYSSI